MELAGTLVVTTYFAALAVLSLFGVHRLAITRIWARTRHQQHQPWLLGAPPRVTVQLPIFNERNVVERLVDAACALRWPADRLQIQVLDDSTDDTLTTTRQVVEAWSRRGVDIQLLHRTDRRGYKAGALEAGLASASGELIAVFDADFLPQPEFLERMVPDFADPRVGMVQARWGHLNEDHSLLTRLQAGLLDGHFVVEHTARNRSGCFFNFNGTAGILRKQCIVEAGGWDHDTTTEDLDLSYRAQLLGWRFVYRPEVVVPAELPEDMCGFKTQQHRWAKGSLQTARKLLGRILRAPLPVRVRLEASVHLLSNLAYPLVVLMALLMPPAVMVRGRAELVEALFLDLPAFLLATGSVGVFYGAAYAGAYSEWKRRLWRLLPVMSLGLGMAVNQTRAVIEGLFGSDVTFVRTPKSGNTRLRAYHSAAGWTPWIELAFATYYAAAIGLAAHHGYWASLPFMALFGFGFGFVGLRSLFDRPQTAARGARRVELPAAK